MLKFEVYKHGSPAKSVNLSGSYVFGQDGIPLRADLLSEGNEITCVKTTGGASGLSLLWATKNCGVYMLSTTRLPSSPKPYNLNLELARGQIMKLYKKREDWALFDTQKADILNKEFDKITREFIRALNTNNSDPGEASLRGDDVLNKGVIFGEKMALFHAELLTKKRLMSGKPKPTLGISINLDSPPAPAREQLPETVNFISIPTPWAKTEPTEQQFCFDELDDWINWGVSKKIPVHAGPLLSFDEGFIPEWASFWRNDFDELQKRIFAHIQRIVERYESKVKLWNVVSGLAAVNSYNLNFEQITELTRKCCRYVKQLAPQSTVLIDLSHPWGEYYARNQRTIPPMLYADMAFQNDIQFDAFGIHLQMGATSDGYYVRDLFQIGSLMDEFSVHGKALHITACQVPSSVRSDRNDAWAGRAHCRKAGAWHAMWSPRLQAEWLQAIYRLGMSRSFVESLCWGDLGDVPGHHLPNGGLCTEDMTPKLALTEMRHLKADRNKFLSNGNTTP
jgi:hypothetical protein